MSSQGGTIPVAKDGELYSLKWHTYQGHLAQGIQRFYGESDALRDVTLGSEGQYIRSHKFLLSLCSPYFRQLFESNKTENSNTIVILEHLKFKDLRNVVHFIYNGEIKVKNVDLKGFLKAGELLQIEGLAKGASDSYENSPPPSTSYSQPPPSKPGPSASNKTKASSSFTESTSQSQSQSQPPPPKRTRLGRVIKPTVPQIDYDDSNFSLEEQEVETDLLALESIGTVTVQENNRLAIACTAVDPVSDGGGLEPEDCEIIPIDQIKSEDMGYYRVDSSNNLTDDGVSGNDSNDVYNQSYDPDTGDPSVAGPSSAITDSAGGLPKKSGELQYFTSRQGKTMIACNGYLYHFCRKGLDKTRWKCLSSKNMKLKCLGRLDTDIEMTERWREVGQHNHKPNEELCAARVAGSLMLDFAKDSTEPSAEIVKRLLETVPTETAKALPKVQSIMRRIQRERAKKRVQNQDNTETLKSELGN